MIVCFGAFEFIWIFAFRNNNSNTLCASDYLLKSIDSIVFLAKYYFFVCLLCFLLINFFLFLLIVTSVTHALKNYQYKLYVVIKKSNICIPKDIWEFFFVFHRKKIDISLGIHGNSWPDLWKNWNQLIIQKLLQSTLSVDDETHYESYLSNIKFNEFFIGVVRSIQLTL